MARVESWLVLTLPVGLLASTNACISDTDCGICDPKHLVLESISGPNYADRSIHLLTPGVERGQTFVDEIGPCVESFDATNPERAIRGPEEWCKISPLATVSGLSFVFNNLLDPTSVELVRKQPTNPNLFEVYDWKTRILHVEGPITRFNGDYRVSPGDAPDRITRAVNLSCIDNLREQGVAFDAEALAAGVCDGFHSDASGRKFPLDMQLRGRVESFEGETDWRVGGCSAPPSGPDTCCNVCDYELSVDVVKYGLMGEGGARRTPAEALTCDPEGNVYEQCAEFVVDVDRSFEINRYAYAWNGPMATWRLPLYDKVRETHPELRPPGVESDGAACQTDVDCSEQLGGDPGAVCIGETAEGVACTPATPGCGGGHCKAEWFVVCKPAPNLGQLGTCVDARFKDKGAGACYLATEDFQACDPVDGTCTTVSQGNRLARADAGATPNGTLDADEACQASLGSPPGGPCDPLFQPNVVPVPRFDRDQSLPAENRDCSCSSPKGQPPECPDLIEKFCTAPWGKLVRSDGESNAGAYVTREVIKNGGVIYDPALKGVLWLPGDRGNQPRSLVESCAEFNPSPLIGGRNIQDGWRMNDGNSVGNRDFFEREENFDRGMCSGSTYEVVFAREGEQLRDKVGNHLDELRYTFETPEFHVIPGSGYPTDNLRIGACQPFEIRLSNKYDLDPRNLAKLEIWSVEPLAGTNADEGDCSESMAPECWQPSVRIAGGQDCSEDPQVVADAKGSIVPCLTVDVTDQGTGGVAVEIDTVRFGVRLAHADGGSGRYRLVVPGLDHVARFADLDLDDPADRAAYAAAFHDVCGMPLITGGGRGYTDFLYDFSIDEPKCKEDLDRDGIPHSCDNANDLANADQSDQDLDGFGDVDDLCELTPSSSNTADSDIDGVGNDCDVCRKPPGAYNLGDALPIDPRYWVRNARSQTDTDRDGIGDVCDNCVAKANCGIFGIDLTPHSVGVPVPDSDSGVCQKDIDANWIGDLCADQDQPDAAGPVGFEASDDFDQDGVGNGEDACPRQPVERQI